MKHTTRSALCDRVHKLWAVHAYSTAQNSRAKEGENKKLSYKTQNKQVKYLDNNKIHLVQSRNPEKKYTYINIEAMNDTKIKKMLL